MSETPEKATQPVIRRGYEKDAYPKMIIVCIVISLTLLFVILGSIFWDLNSDTRDVPADLTPEEKAFFEEHGVSTQPSP